MNGCSHRIERKQQASGMQMTHITFTFSCELIQAKIPFYAINLKTLVIGCISTRQLTQTTFVEDIERSSIEGI